MAWSQVRKNGLPGSDWVWALFAIGKKKQLKEKGEWL